MSENSLMAGSRRARIPMLVALITVAAVTVLNGSASGGVANRFPGAFAIKKGKVPLQKRARAIAPKPHRAFSDRGKPFADGCLTYKPSQVESPPCVYGDPSSDTTVVIFGDSRALQYSPALLRLARKKGWRLVVLTRGLCSVADVPHKPDCDKWRENTLQRIRNKEHPDLVLVGNSTLYFYPAGGWDKLPTMTKGMTRTLKRLKATGAKVVVARDQSAAPFRHPGECVAEHRRNLLRCAWRPKSRKPYSYDLWAAKKARVPTINPQGHVCRPKLCPTVIGNVIVYRDLNHYSATFMRTLSRWIGRQLPRIR